MNLSKVSIEKLQAEIDSRKTPKQPKPKPLPYEERNYATLNELCEEYVNQVDAIGCVEDGMNGYIFESAIEAVFGRDVWDWINKFNKG